MTDSKLEITEKEYQGLPIEEQRKYRRQAARDRKRAQRQREKEGIPPGVKAKLEKYWQENLAALQSDSTRVEELNALGERWADFAAVREMARAVINRIRQGIHPEDVGAGRFYEIVARDTVIEHAKKYGLDEFAPPWFLVYYLEIKITHFDRLDVLEKMKADPTKYYRMTYGSDIDYYSELEYYEFLDEIIRWYLKNRDNPDYGYDWTDADQLVATLDIPAKFLAGLFSKHEWIQLDKRRHGVRTFGVKQWSTPSIFHRAQSSRNLITTSQSE